MEPLGDGLHHAVLDAVVDHLHEVTRPRPLEELVAIGLGDIGEEGLDLLEVLLMPADHQTRAVPRSVRTATRPAVQEAQSRLGQPRSPGGRVLVERVAAIDDEVAFIEELDEATIAKEHVVHRLAGGKHEPDDARLREVLDELGHRVRRR